MNIQNYILPVSIAAALHVALLCSGTKEPRRETPAIIEVPLPPLPPQLEDTVVAPEEKSDTEQPVRPLAGGPTPLSIEDPPVMPELFNITIPRQDTTREFVTDLKIIPERFGPGEPGSDGPHVAPPGIFSPTQLDRVPRATVQPPPDYPAIMRQANITGSVTVEFEVDTEGRVVRAEAIRCTHHEFAGPAVRAVLRWHFEPGRRNGRPVPFRMAIPIEFSLPAD